MTYLAKHLLPAAQYAAVALAAAVFAIGAAQANPVEGTWASPPDRKGQTGHVVIQSCGAAFCGKVVRAYDRSGAQISTKNVGKRVIWDMAPAGSGLYKGRIFVPLAGRDFPGKLTLQGGNRMEVEGCAGVLGCKTQTWKRVN